MIKILSVDAIISIIIVLNGDLLNMEGKKDEHCTLYIGYNRRKMRVEMSRTELFTKL